MSNAGIDLIVAFVYFQIWSVYVYPLESFWSWNMLHAIGIYFTTNLIYSLITMKKVKRNVS